MAPQPAQSVPEPASAMENDPRQSGRSERPAEDAPAFLGGRGRESAEAVRRLKSRASRGLVTFAVFLAISIVAAGNLTTFHQVPERVRQLLGAAPQTTAISAALIIYSFSAILMTLSRMTIGSGSHGGLSHVAFLTGFYAFYYLSDCLPDNFWAVFAAGVTILGLEAYQIWNWCREEIRKELEGVGGEGIDER
jgi:hypothetical protein